MKEVHNAGMTLRDFVADTLTQISGGVSDAQKENPGIAPPVGQHAGSTAYVVWPGGISHPGAFLVDFDVAVTVSHKTETGAKGGISVHVFEAGANRESSAEHSTVSRIKFQVPVTFDDLEGRE